MKLPNWLRPILTLGLGMVFKNNKIPVETADAIMQSIPLAEAKTSSTEIR